MRAATRVAAGIGGVVLLAATAIAVVSEVRLARRFEVEPVRLEVARDPATLARGRHLVEVVTQCTTCHGDDLAGKELADDFWIGRLWGPNLTRGRGGLGDLGDADLVRAIRHGVKRDGTSVALMPAQHLRHLTDRDLAAIVAFLRALEPVDREVPPARMGPLTRVVVALGLAPELLPAGLVAAEPLPTRDAAADRGAYLVETAGCRVCHNPELTGGLHALSLPGEPEPPDLTPAGRLKDWSAGDFVRALRTGRTREGRALDATYMPWPAYSRMSDAELLAIWRYLETLPART